MAFSWVWCFVFVVFCVLGSAAKEPNVMIYNFGNIGISVTYNGGMVVALSRIWK